MKSCITFLATLLVLTACGTIEKERKSLPGEEQALFFERNSHLKDATVSFGLTSVDREIYNVTEDFSSALKINELRGSPNPVERYEQYEERVKEAWRNNEIPDGAYLYRYVFFDPTKDIDQSGYVALKGGETVYQEWDATLKGHEIHLK